MCVCVCVWEERIEEVKRRETQDGDGKRHREGEGWREERKREGGMKKREREWEGERKREEREGGR